MAQRKGEMNQFQRNLEGRIDLGRFGLFDEGFLPDDDDDAGIGDVEAAAVGFEVVADLGALGKADVAVNDGGAAAGGWGAVYMILASWIISFPKDCCTDSVSHCGQR